MRIIILDDHILFLQGLSTLLKQHIPDAKIESYSNVESAYHAIKQNPDSDLLLADIYMPKYQNKTIMELLNEANLFVPVLLVSATDDILQIKRSLDLNASGFVHKSSEPAELINAIHSVINEGSYLESRVAKCLENIKQIRISKRQQQVLDLLANGLSNKRIGNDLGISEITVKSHISALFDYFNAANRLDCIRKAERSGLVTSNYEY